jgi:curved DNA-binding protein CbpA
MTDLDPYEQLGVQRDAGTATIRAAYRRRAQEHHPDKGGDPEEWERTATALAVLTDPKRRQAFDETGSIAPEAMKPDNERAAALAIVEQHVAAIINEFATSGGAPDKDPRKFDVMLRVRDAIWAESREAENGIDGGNEHIKFLTDMRRRFRLKHPDKHPEGDPIVRGFTAQIQRAEQQIAQLRDAIKVRILAVDIASDYEFERDKPAPDPYVWPASGISLSDLPSYPARMAAEWGDGT